MAKLMIFECPYCGYEREGQADSVIYCGPHVACFGGATYPKVRMVAKPDPAQRSKGGDDDC